LKGEERGNRWGNKYMEQFPSRKEMIKKKECHQTSV